MPFAALLCVLLVGHHVQAVVNKVPSQVPLSKEEEKSAKTKADDRIGSTFASPSDDYGPPLGGSGFNGPAPVYGPPELVGNTGGPAPIYPPPPPELPPPVFGPPPPVFYGPPRSIKPQYGPPKQSYGLPKLHYGPPKQHFAPPSVPFPSFRLPKPQYGPPLKLVAATGHQQYAPPKPPGHGPPIPISLETYGPPPAKLAIQFNPLPNDEYGPPPPPPPPPVSAPQPQYGPPAGGDLYGPPPPAPPPGVPAPPTPPDIKYDGWQPIAGLASGPNQSGPPTDTYGPPTEAKHNYIESASSSSSGAQLSHADLAVPTDSKLLSDSYGTPIHSPDAQDLKTSVRESSASSESNGLPPPPLPQYEPLHNNQGPGAVLVKHNMHVDHQQQDGAPNIEPLSIVKTVGFELLPADHQAAQQGDLQGLSLSGGGAPDDSSSLNHISSSIGANSASLHTAGLELTSDDGGASHGLQNIGADLSLQQLPQQQTPSSDYGPPLINAVTFGQSGGIASTASLLSPPLLDSYGAPPPSSYSPNGPYAAAQGGGGGGGRGSSPFSSFGLFGNSFHKQTLHHHRHHGPFRPPPPPPLGSLMPPRTREPIKFKEPIPTGLLSNINRYLPPFTRHKSHGVPLLPLGQQLPSLHAPVSFHHHTSGTSDPFGGSFSLGGYNLNSPIAAPHVQYGTPLSFTDFNTPTPHLTYGAPNFGPPASFVSTSTEFGGNLYSGVGNALTATYGTPVANNAPLSIGGGHDCDQPLLPVNGALSGEQQLPLSGGESHSGGELRSSVGLSATGGAGEELSLNGGLNAHNNGQLQFGYEGGAVGGAESPPGPVYTDTLSASYAANGGDPSDGNRQNAIYTGAELPLAKPFDDFLGGPPVNTLDLQHNEQQKTNLRDSYGNPIGVTYDDSSNEASDARTVHAPTADVTNELSAHSPSSQSHNIYSAATSFERGSGISAEALTASLTAQGFGQGKNFGGAAANEVDASQFLKSSEGSEALALAQGLTANGVDGFEIHGSKGTYTLQIQPADGGLGGESSDGSIRHDQVLSNGLLQDILAAIEQPQNGGRVQLHGRPEPLEPLEKVFGDSLPQGTTAVAKGHFVTVDSRDAQDNDRQQRIEKRVEKPSGGSEDVKYSKHQPVALFFDTKYAEAKKEIGSASKNQA